jgi:type IV secretion system protein VirB9
VIVKPLVPDISTNLVVMTDRRTYNLDLVAHTTDFIPSVRFNYPDEVMAGWSAFIAGTREKQQSDVVLAEGYRLSPENLYFGYTITKGKNLAWSPVRVFDDGTKTYIEMPAKYHALEAPVLMLYEGKQQKLVNYRVKDRFYVVDRVMTTKAVLMIGQSRVIIERKKEFRS